MPVKRGWELVVPVMAVTLLFAATLAFAEPEPIEYQDRVDVESLLNQAESAESAQSGKVSHFADATSARDVPEGLQIYKVQCSGCHGRQLQGQALWQAQDSYAGLRAPPHDDTGHTWQHSDEDLYRKVRTGHIGESPQRFADSTEAQRHAFQSILSEEKILQVLAFIKARWSLGIRVAQSTLNPQFQGMPQDADTVPWTFPPTCQSSK